MHPYVWGYIFEQFYSLGKNNNMTFETYTHINIQKQTHTYTVLYSATMIFLSHFVTEMHLEVSFYLFQVNKSQA